MKIFVGMSGGVDSSVSALLMKKRGHDVTGVFIKTWQPGYIECTWKEDRLDAMRVCAQLDIPFITLDLEKEYKEYVIDYFLNEYKNNRVPNGDIMCNKYIKFGAFLKFAMDSAADAIATGHYAKIKGENLYAGSDESKDQSYFLYQIKKEDLSKIIFPIADIRKTAVRDIAKKNSLCVAEKKDSQGICMLGGDVSVKDFLIHELKTKEGEVIKEGGEVIGSHSGVEIYTIGERHGFEIVKKIRDSEPYFIIKKDIENNRLTVSHESPLINKSEDKENNFVTLIEFNVLSEIDKDKVYFARSRYRGELKKVKVNQDEKSIEMLEDMLCVPGQSVVVYDEKDRVICGGVIK
jgi:tRNA-specific 2-thiouridylase